MAIGIDCGLLEENIFHSSSLGAMRLHSQAQGRLSPLLSFRHRLRLREVCSRPCACAWVCVCARAHLPAAYIKLHTIIASVTAVVPSARPVHCRSSVLHVAPLPDRVASAFLLFPSILSLYVKGISHCDGKPSANRYCPSLLQSLNDENSSHSNHPSN